MADVIRKHKPLVAVIENVAALQGRGLDAVVRELESAGYACEATVLRACDVGAPHRRRRMFIVARRADAFEGVRLRRMGRDGGGFTWRRWTELRADALVKVESWSDRTDEEAAFGEPLWPTARASDGRSPGAWDGHEGGNRLSVELRLWSTATNRDACVSGGSKKLDGRRGELLETAARTLWPTTTGKGLYNKAGASERSGDGLVTALWAARARRRSRRTGP